MSTSEDDLLETYRLQQREIEVQAAMSDFLLAAGTDGDELNSDAKSELRKYWSLAARLILDFVEVSARTGHAAPISLLSQLGWLLDDLGRGVVDPSIENARSDGGRPVKRSEINEISRALFFLEAVDSGSIACSSPVKTVADAFNVTKQTVRNWRNDHARLTENQQRPHPNLIEESMRYAGLRYSVRGRGAPSP